ncbi:hypothetical protein ARMGADRAFT_1137290, partial [Armillaria gallica]
VSRCHYLGLDTHYTIFESELMGAILVLDIICETPRLIKAYILLDLQAMLLAIKTQKTKSGCYLLEEFFWQLERLRKKWWSLEITMMWISRHKEIDGNEEADWKAKIAVEDTPPHYLISAPYFF